MLPRILQKIPTGLVLALLWVGFKSMGETALSSVTGIILLIGCFAVILVEFIKSGDITLTSFGWDLAYSVLTTIVGSVAMTTFVMQSATISIPDVLVCVVILIDAWVSPFNSFRVALRNFMGGSVQTTQ